MLGLKIKLSRDRSSQTLCRRQSLVQQVTTWQVNKIKSNNNNSGERVESESRIAKIYGPNVQTNLKSIDTKKSLIYTWEKKKLIEIVSDFRQMLN